MFAPITSNKTVSIVCSENGGYIIQYYDNIPAPAKDSLQVRDDFPGQARFQMKVLTAQNTEQAASIVREVLEKMKGA